MRFPVKLLSDVASGRAEGEICGVSMLVLAPGPLRFAELAEACRTRFGNEGGGPESVFRLAYANAATLTSYSHTIRDAAHGRTHVGEKRSGQNKRRRIPAN